jgi:hypothetical protein
MHIKITEGCVIVIKCCSDNLTDRIEQKCSIIIWHNERVKFLSRITLLGIVYNSGPNTIRGPDKNLNTGRLN